MIGRVVEYRLAGLSNRESVLCALARTGRVITSAGIIMAIAFVSLVQSGVLRWFFVINY
jgi:uncharacterized membrane protein YdfJ with MMPL/SSD domain